MRILALAHSLIYSGAQVAMLEFLNVPATLDAMLLRVPVAKILHPRFYRRQDYTEDEILIVEYINNFDHCHEYFSRNVYEFIKRKRLLDKI